MGWLRRDVYGGSLGDTWVTFLRRRTFPRSERTSLALRVCQPQCVWGRRQASTNFATKRLLQAFAKIFTHTFAKKILANFNTVFYNSFHQKVFIFNIILCSDSSMTINVNNSSHRVGIIPHQTNISPLYCCFANTWKVFAHNFKWNSDPPLNLKERRWWQHGTLLLSTTSTPPRS